MAPDAPLEETWTIRRVVTWSAADFSARGLDSPRLDAELLVAEALGLDRVGLYMDLDRPLLTEELAAIRGLVQRRRRREPVAYILGRREFYGRTFQVSPATLVPRPDTEVLVEAALARLPGDMPARVLDIGTGTGAIVISLLLERPSARATATDISAAALQVAEKNARVLGALDRLDLLEGDLFEALRADALGFDLVVSNPPYIRRDELATLSPDVKEHEPVDALVGGDDGLSVIRRIVQGVGAHLRPGGRLLLEVGQGQAPAVEALCIDAGLSGPQRHRDLAGIERVVEVARPA